MRADPLTPAHGRHNRQVLHPLKGEGVLINEPRHYPILAFPPYYRRTFYLHGAPVPCIRSRLSMPAMLIRRPIGVSDLACTGTESAIRGYLFERVVKHAHPLTLAWGHHPSHHVTSLHPGWPEACAGHPLSPFFLGSARARVAPRPRFS